MRDFTKMRILVTIRYICEALFMPYLSLYLSDIGFSEAQIGIFIALIPITGILFTPLYSLMCKTPRAAKHCLSLMGIFEALSMFLLLYTGDSFVLTVLLIVSFSAFSSSNYGLLDSLMANFCEVEGKTFSAIRIFGSISYIFGMGIAFLFIRFSTYYFLFLAAAITSIIVSVLYVFIKIPKKTLARTSDVERPKLKEVLFDKKFILYVIFYVLLMGSMQVGDDFFSIYLKAKGSEDYVYSFVLMGFVTIEVIVMLLLAKFGKRLGVKLYFAAAALLVVRTFIQQFESASVGVLIASQMLRGFIMGTILYLNSMFVIEILDVRRSTLGILINTMCVAIFSGAFKICGGYIIEGIGYPAFYRILLCFNILALIYYFFYYFKIYCSKPENK